jgi:Tfp pilus assembly protein PilN
MLGVSISVYLFIYNNAILQTEHTNTAIAEVATAQANQSQLKTLVATLETTKADRDRIAKSLIPIGQTVQFIEAVENVGKVIPAKVSIVSINSDDLSLQTAGAIGTLQAHIEVEGSWSNALRAMHLIESLPYSISTDSARANTRGSHVWNVSFDVKALVIK